ncbi:MAG TPA: TolC family protein, partial [Candidatus Eisenbacteria bacterium]
MTRFTRGAVTAAFLIGWLAAPGSAAANAPNDAANAAATADAPAPATAAGSDSTRSLQAAVARALSTFPSVRAAESRRDEAKAASKEAAAAFFPTLAIQSDATRFEEPALVTPIHSFALTTLPPFNRTLVQSSLTAGITLFDGGARVNRYRSARETSQGSEASLDQARQSLLTQTVAAYLTVLGDRELLEAHDHRLAALRGERDRVQRLLDTGKAARVELLRVEAELASAEADRVRAAASLDDAERQLGRLTGLDAERTRAGNLAEVALVDTTLTPRA